MILYTDIDECKQSGVCLPTERCINTYGSYRCIRDTSCPVGHQVNPLTKACEGDYIDPLFSLWIICDIISDIDECAQVYKLNNTSVLSFVFFMNELWF